MFEDESKQIVMFELQRPQSTIPSAARAEPERSRIRFIRVTHNYPKTSIESTCVHVVRMHAQANSRMPQLKVRLGKSDGVVLPQHFSYQDITLFLRV